MKKLFGLLKPYRKKLIAVALIDGIGIICAILMPFVMSEIVEIGISERNVSVVWRYAVIMVLLAVVASIANVISVKLNTTISSGYSSDLCRATFEKINALSYTDYTKIGPSGLLTRATDDIWNVEGTITSLPFYRSRYVYWIGYSCFFSRYDFVGCIYAIHSTYPYFSTDPYATAL